MQKMRVRIKEGIPYGGPLGGAYGTFVRQNIGGGHWHTIAVNGSDKTCDWVMIREDEIVRPYLGEAVVAKYARIKKNVYSMWNGDVAPVVHEGTAYVTLQIGNERVLFSRREIDMINGKPMELLQSYAKTQAGLNVVARNDGSFYVKNGKGREIYSVIYGNVPERFETWDYSRGQRGVHRTRNIESVKRSLRRLRVRES